MVDIVIKSIAALVFVLFFGSFIGSGIGGIVSSVYAYNHDLSLIETVHWYLHETYWWVFQLILTISCGIIYWAHVVDERSDE